jgi:hypothetical protein
MVIQYFMVLIISTCFYNRAFSFSKLRPSRFRRYLSLHAFSDNRGTLSDDDDDNIHKPWSADDDRMLYNAYMDNQSLEAMCIATKRGVNGVKARIR